ncbi:B3 domain-containing transcription factor LEC2-like isoform X2 [Argentina anserina]|uniref:B3 domain-containing transcription factor LEC2-like isoform X2 n=1 Tax=Argentina anserina TaxID=57926 RepID=UPI0021769406|nr:B3 domain-containing transcription factor LEC2-like isoform X2 [Potentilla anserina]
METQILLSCLLKPSPDSIPESLKDQLLCHSPCVGDVELHPPITHLTATISSSSPPSFLASSSFQSYYYPGVKYLPPHPYWQQQQPFLPHPPSMSPSSVPPLQPSSLVDADARERSRIARQRRSLILRKRNAARSMAAFSRLEVERDAAGVGSDMQNNRKRLSSSLDNTELNNHDVGSLGRVLLPKVMPNFLSSSSTSKSLVTNKEVKKYRPILSNKEGIQLMIRHTHSKWGSKSKYWSNNKSRMHVFGNSVGTGSKTQNNKQDLYSFCNGSQTQNNKQDLYTFCTPDNMALRLLFRKELKNSDTGSYGRIVLPKKDAEKCLPSLFDKEGIKLMIRDIHSNQQWDFKFKYWPNNKSRMYVFENTGDFVRQSGVKVGDSINLYEDECKNLYISIQKAETRPVHAPEPSYQQSCYTITKDYAANCCSSHIDAVENGKANTINNNRSSNKDNSNSLEKNPIPNIDNTNSKTHAKATSTYIPYAGVRPEEDESSLAVLL